MKINFLFLCLFLPLFFYNLGRTSLVDFDEAWYAEIAQNIIEDRQLFLLSFNGVGYLDHPPLGFILIALSFLFFGINEFAARFPSALLGFGSIILLYLIGKNLFNRTIATGACLMLISSVWFIFRARSGNLDTIFVFFYLLTFYSALKVKENYKWIYFLSISLACVLLVKSVIGITVVLPALAILFIRKTPINTGKIILAIVLFLIILSPWFILNYQNSGSRFTNKMIKVGLRAEDRVKPNFLEIGSSLTFTYLHLGVREWYYPALIAVVGSVPFIFKKPILLSLYLWIFILLFGFLTNKKTEIWHLLPLYPPLALFIAFFFYQLIHLASVPFFSFSTAFFTEKLNFKKKQLSILTQLIFVVCLSFLAVKQIYEFRNEIGLFNKDVSGLAATATTAREYPQKLFLDADYFFPQVVFYSGKNVTLIRGNVPPKNTLKGIIELQERPFLLITEQWRLDLDKIDPNKYQTISSHKGYVLLRIGN